MNETTYWTRRRLSRRGMLRGAAVGTAGVAGAVLIGCGSDDDGGDDSPTAAPSASGGGGGGQATAAPTEAAMTDGNQGGDLVIAASSDMQRLDFQRTISSPTQRVAHMVHNRLMEFDPQSPPNTWVIRPDLAESWEATAETFTFKLNEGVKFQNVDPLNGRELTSEDVKFTYDRVRTEDPEFVWAYKLASVDSIDTPDDNTVVFNMNAPAASMLLDLAHGPGMGIVPREIIDADGDYDSRWVGTGPFILDEYEPGSYHSFVRNPDYFRESRPYLDSVRVEIVKDATTRFSNFLGGRSAMHDASPEEVGQIESSLGVDVISYAALSSTHLVPNAGSNGTPEMQDLRIRQAINGAIDREQLLSLAWGGEGTVAGPALHPGMGPFAPTEDWVKEHYVQDIAESMKLLDAAGASDLKIPVHYSNVDSRATDMLPVVKQQLSDAGIDIDLLPEERAVYLQRQVDASFTLQAIGSGTGPDPDSILYPYYHTDGGKNWSRVSDPELDARIEAERAELDEEARNALLLSLAEEWTDYLYRIHMLFPTRYYAWQENVHNGFLAKGADWRPMEEVWLS